MLVIFFALIIFLSASITSILKRITSPVVVANDSVFRYRDAVCVRTLVLCVIFSLLLFFLTVAELGKPPSGLLSDPIFFVLWSVAFACHFAGLWMSRFNVRFISDGICYGAFFIRKMEYSKMVSVDYDEARGLIVISDGVRGLIINDMFDGFSRMRKMVMDGFSRGW